MSVRAYLNADSRVIDKVWPWLVRVLNGLKLDHSHVSRSALKARGWFNGPRFFCNFADAITSPPAPKGHIPDSTYQIAQSYLLRMTARETILRLRLLGATPTQKELNEI